MVHVRALVHAQSVDDPIPVVDVLVQSFSLSACGQARFGWSLAAGRYTTETMSVVVGAPGSLNLAGVVSLFNNGNEFPAMPQQDFGEAWWQDSIFAAEPSEVGDFFGMSLGAGGLPWLMQ